MSITGGNAVVDVARHHAGLVDRVDHRLVPLGLAAGLQQLARDDGAVGRDARTTAGALRISPVKVSWA